MEGHLSQDFSFTCTDVQAGVIYEPWTNGWAVGFRAVFPDGQVRYLYLNPSADGGGDPDHTASVFVYEGPHGDPATDTSQHYYDLYPY